MKAIFTLLLFAQITAHSQVISRFTWNSTPLTNAASGPNGTSVSTSAVSEFVGGSIGYAINPGLPTKNVDLVIPGTSFDVNDIDIDFYFRREESVASFFKRGSLFNFQMNNGNLTITFTTTQGSTPGNITINSGNIYAVPDDHNFHHYRFYYDNNQGIGKAFVDGNVVYTYTGFAGRPLDWTGAGNVVIGENMDATSRNIAVLANFTIQHIASSTLPVTLISFSGTAKNQGTRLEWSTTNENGFSHFLVERSSNGIQFAPIATVAASKSLTSVKEYEFYDSSPLSGSNYYRLKMIDKDNSFKYAEVIRIESASVTASACYPNPATNYVTIAVMNGSASRYSYSVTTLQGNIVRAAVVTTSNGSNQLRIDLSGNVPAGMLIIRLQDNQSNKVETFRVVKSNA